jgi:hypothetical protein
MPKDKKEPGGVYIGLKKAGELEKQLEENKKAKGGLNKFMKERSGAAVTQKEAEKLSNEYKYKKLISGASVTDAERERLEKFMPDKNIDDSDFENKTKAMEGYLKEAQKIKDNSQNYADGGEVVFGKGKDYIKDLL